MAIYVAPEDPYSSRLALGPGYTGLVGTIRYRLLDNDPVADDPIYGPDTVDIIEDPTGSGDYVFNGTAPDTVGHYAPAWDMGPGTALIYDEDLVVTSDGAATIVTGTLYLTASELKHSIELDGTTFADDDIDLALVSACRAIDGYMQQTHAAGPFFQTAATRYYTVDPYAVEVALGDITIASEVSVDRDGDGTYSETWEEGVHFYLDPPNAGTDDQPFKRLVLRRQSMRRFPGYQRNLKVQGVFGWAATPPQVKTAAKILATRLVKRGDVPFAIQTAGTEMVAMARLGRIDPDVAWQLDQIPGAFKPSLRSVQLG